MPLLPVLAAMERTGITVDPAVLAEQSKQLQQTTRTLEKDIIELAGGPFNLNSPRQLGEVLFGRLRLSDKPKKTKTGQYQTNEEVLQELTGKHPIIEKILDYRETSKLLSTYVDALPEEIFSRTGRIHTTYLQLIVATGRLSSNQPNLQNIPIRTPQGREVRRAFIPARGWKLLCADYSQIELRVMAALSDDEGMKHAFAEGLDIHSATASRVYGVPIAELLPEMRRAAKMVNFGIIYGISAFGLSQRLSIPREEARRIIDEYFVQYAGVKRFMDQVVTTAREKGYVQTMIGRRRPLRDIASANATLRSAAERVAINAPIQGTAADMIKLAMIRVAEKLRTGGYQARLLLQVHDELVLEVPPDEIDAVQSLVRQEMTEALPLPGVPIVVECGIGDHWLEAH
jgi:DNA polymerase I